MADQLIRQLAEQSLLGLLLAICIAMIFVLAKLVLNEKDKRIEDAQKVRDDIVAPINNLTEFVKAALNGRDK